MEQIAGIEPVLPAWEAEVLTIERYLHLVLSMGFEPIRQKHCRLKTACLPISPQEH